jgi:hypothetical protein
MKLTRFPRIMSTGAAAGLTMTAVWLTAITSPAAAEGENGRLHIVKDCGNFSGVPGSSFCTIISSNLNELPAGTQIYYNQITGGPSVGPSYLDSTVFVYVSQDQWAIGRCTLRNDNPPGPLGLCTLSDGLGPLAGINARVTVTYQPGGDGAVYDWDGTYSFKSPGK